MRSRSAHRVGEFEWDLQERKWVVRDSGDPDSEPTDQIGLRKPKTIFDALGPRQIEALCNVAFGGSGGGQPKRTLESLEHEGLIERVENEDRRGGLTFRWTEWTMPVGVHIDFCAWCAEQGIDGDSE